MELERADGEEGFVSRVSVVFGVKDGDELVELGRRGGGDAERSGKKGGGCG